jgi:hypothetical protein
MFVSPESDDGGWVEMPLDSGVRDRMYKRIGDTS